MAGGQPFTGQSPTQSARFVTYSPTSKSNNYNYDQYQPPPHTPPSFPPATLAQSPHFGHPLAVPSPTSMMNGNGHLHSDAPAQYQINPTSPHHQHSRPFSSSMNGPNGHPAYNNVASSHAHPSSTQGSLPVSPTQDYTPTMNSQRLNMTNSGDLTSAAQPSRPSSQEVINLKTRSSSNVLTPSQQKPVRANDPMSFASILSEPATRATPSQDKMRLVSKSTQVPTMDSSIKTDKVKLEDDQTLLPAASVAESTPKPTLNGHRISRTGSAVKPVTKPRKSLTATEYERISRAMEALDSQPLSDVEESDFVAEKEHFTLKNRKRALELEEVDNMKRKVRNAYKCHQYLLTVPSAQEDSPARPVPSIVCHS
jgi:chromatin-remodeling ATPase INO80